MLLEGRNPASIPVIQRGGATVNESKYPMGSPFPDIRFALVHYWLVRQRGGEKVLQHMVDALGPTDIFTNVHDPRYNPDWLDQCELRTTFVNRLPFSRQLLSAYLPLMPAALGALDLGRYDVVISSEAGPAKWVVAPPEALHICYVHSPMRYVWDQMGAYTRRLPAPARLLAYLMAERLRMSDTSSAQRVDHFIANSRFVARRIGSYYRREAQVIHPPVSVPATLVAAPTEDFYLCAGQLVPYKRVEIAIEACARLNRRLVIVGVGSEEKHLRRLAGPNVEFRGFLPENELRHLFRTCRAMLFPGVEDFGITPVEVMGEGRPVIAFARGGALDYVEHGLSGILYHEEGAQGLVDAMLAFEAEEGHFRSDQIHAHAKGFDESVFRSKFLDCIGGLVGSG